MRASRSTRRQVLVAEGRALIALGNRHSTVIRDRAHYAVEVKRSVSSPGNQPSVGVLFRSVAAAARLTSAEDEASCVVFGVRKEAISRGAVDDVLPLSRIPALCSAEPGLLAWSTRDGAGEAQFDSPEGL
jgi:chemotaxis response regulator CheB